MLTCSRALRFAHSRTGGSGSDIAPVLRVGGTEVQLEHARFFDEPSGVWSSRDRKLEKRVENLQRKKRLREKFEYARTARRDDGGADLSQPFDNQLLYGARRQSSRVAGGADAGWAESVRQVRVGQSVQKALDAIFDTDYRAHQPHHALFTAQLCIDAVRMTRDTRVARVYFSTVDTAASVRTSVYRALIDAAPALRMLLVRRVPLKYAPELKFMKEIYNLEQNRAELAIERMLAEQKGEQKEEQASAQAVPRGDASDSPFNTSVSVHKKKI